MEVFKRVGFLFLIVFFSCCKKSEQAVIAIQDVFFSSNSSTQVDINYKLSQLGYQETGVYFWKKNTPGEVNKRKAIRVDEVLQLSLLNLDAESEYAFRVFYLQDDLEKTDETEYVVRTLAESRISYALKVDTQTVYYDENGNFSFEIEGENLHQLNLSELKIAVSDAVSTFDYPVNTEGSNYKIKVTGKAKLSDGHRVVNVIYQEKDILYQTVALYYSGERYWLTPAVTDIPGYSLSVFKNELFYFTNNNVSKWNEREQRLIPVGTGNVQDGFYIGAFQGLEFDNKIFFPAVRKVFLPPGNDIMDSYSFPQAYSYSPTENQWFEYPFMDNQFYQRYRLIKNAQYFIHKGTLFLAFTVSDDSLIDLSKRAVVDNLLYRYNALSKQFEKIEAFNREIVDYHYISIGGQLYLLGLSPVYDQGFQLSTTLCVYKVNASSQMEEVYRGGTVYEPQTFVVKLVTNYEGKILMVTSTNEFLIFDPETAQLVKAHQKTGISEQYLEGLFVYNQKLHLFTNRTVYEIAVTRSH